MPISSTRISRRKESPCPPRSSSLIRAFVMVMEMVMESAGEAQLLRVRTHSAMFR